MACRSIFWRLWIYRLIRRHDTTIRVSKPPSSIPVTVSGFYGLLSSPRGTSFGTEILFENWLRGGVGVLGNKPGLLIDLSRFHSILHPDRIYTSRDSCGKLITSTAERGLTLTSYYRESIVCTIRLDTLDIKKKSLPFTNGEQIVTDDFGDRWIVRQVYLKKFEKYMSVWYETIRNLNDNVRLG